MVAKNPTPPGLVQVLGWFLLVMFLMTVLVCGILSLGIWIGRISTPVSAGPPAVQEPDDTPEKPIPGPIATPPGRPMSGPLPLFENLPSSSALKSSP